MKKVVFIILGLLLMVGITDYAQAQIKIGYVNSDRILSEFDEALEAQSKLDIEARKLEDQYRGMLAKLDSLQKDYERQKMMMSETRRKTKETEIAQLQESIQKFQVEKLGPEGEIYKKQAELVTPVLEKVKTVIAKVGKDNKYDYIFDTVAGNILYAEPAHDVTDKVIYELKRTK
ncbi:MAG: OmpH family outer membrane protein [Candidatus Marinimicrobia bacterium]|nr:OmpH family outer membrane protein [Candidatus Neomarinimicrobiota bacterium]MCK9483243.1 OmpH family outer membrane protein [Candidatus Neomarinimicrobiota bacterium]MCK9559866.1 OmpH family outer membrane protein [Candidatus Neomarinimicrobiota bacterium]MDD5060952.1 OmpH family outer membrane protein [Candidatus Neomarinimicrobiota bacterium]MDD5229827.1 OmpH family outer membrane protein [Candidatus Neomarinimicrobiota bacterium]